MATGRIERAYFWTIKHSFNHVTLWMARSGFGPYALVRHVGRKSGKTFETPILHARTREGFVAVLMYGTQVSWYRNIRAAGHGVVVRGAREYEIDGIERYPSGAGLRAFAFPLRVFLRATRRREFRLLHVAASSQVRGDPPGRVKRAWLWTLKRTLDPLALWMAHRGVGPFSLVRHVGRKSGAMFETPLILARVPDGFIAELTYGTGVNWYRNIKAAGGHGIIIWRGHEYPIDRMESYPTDAGRRAFGVPASWLLTLLRRREFRMLHEAKPPAVAYSQ
jgi:F420H(2)-dependent quinone reductase